MLEAKITPERLLQRSLFLLAAIVFFALAGLALDHNWPKFLRVGAAFAAYVSILLPLQRRARAVAPCWIFVTAGAGAGLVSGLVRPATTPRLVVVQVLTAGILLGGLHWLALRAYRRTRATTRVGA